MGEREGNDVHSTNQVTILIVDDDLQLLDDMKLQLEACFAQVLIAQTPLSALWTLERHPVDAVLCDLVLSSTHGGHLLEQVAERWPRVTRILMTGFGDRVVAPASFPAAQRVLLKPCASDVITNLVGELSVPQ